MGVENTNKTGQNTRPSEYQIEAVYQKVFGIKKFRNFIRDGKKKEIIEYMRFQGEHGAGYGWSDTNSTIVNMSKCGVSFDYAPLFHSFDEIAEMLLDKYQIKK